ncbi:sigma-54 interaction domain-containing protein [Cohnella sp.]|uniref:sigma-54 interaction domain-containing protein n=1 Tax=Cohnella sp. TaxID=1883426 RepID=UPI00356704DB
MQRLKIAVIAGSVGTSSMLCRQLEPLLDGYMKFLPYSVHDWTGSEEVDLVMISSHILFIKHSPFHIKNKTDILIIKRTLSKEGWGMIRQLSPGEKYLVVNDERDSVVESISLLYELGLRHVDLVPYYLGAPDNRNVTMAITPGEPQLVPEYVTHTIDIGARVVDLSTIVELLTRFHLLNSEMRGVLNAYAKTIATSNLGLQVTLQELVNGKNLFEETLNMVQDGVVTFDERGTIAFINDTAEDLLQSRRDASNLSIQQLLRHQGIDPQFLHGDVKDQLITIRDQTVIANATWIRGHSSVRVLILKIAKKVEELELKLRTQLRQNGHAAKFTFKDIVTESPVMKRIIERARKMANNDFSILLLGENGTGKELFAHSIHQYSHRSKFPFIAFNCGALPENLLESELFGYEEGAFTGARRGGKPGLFEQAHKGTIFLDEIGDISPALQTRLLRVLQHKEILKVGGTRMLPVDVRVIAATHRDLPGMVKEGTFREDLYYRLKVLQIDILPLRERKEDIPALIRFFFERRGLPFDLSGPIMEAMLDYEWPGNIRELENTIEYLSIMGDETFGVEDLPFLTQYSGNPSYKSEEEDDNQPVVAQAASPAFRNEGESLGKNRLVTWSVAGIDAESFLLELVLEADRSGRHTGRRNLVGMARERGVIMTENEIRKRMESLRKQGLVDIRLGRSGCTLTAEGFKHLHEGQTAQLRHFIDQRQL